MGIGTKGVVGADPFSLVASVQELDLNRGANLSSLALVDIMTMIAAAFILNMAY